MKRLLGCFAHPDDEVLGPGGTIAHYAKAGVHIEWVCATRGEAGEIADPSLATPETLAQVREAEMLCAAQTLGIRHVHFLGYRDSGMPGTEDNNHPQAFMNAPAAQVVPQLVAIIRQVRPHVILTFEPWGGYGHPDHIAINRHTLAAVAAAADPTYHPNLGTAWDTPRLFYELLPVSVFENMRARMAARGMDTSWFERIEERREKGWPDDQVHCILDVSATVTHKWAALLCHRTQFGPDNLFRRLPEEEMKALLSREYFALVRPTVSQEFRLNDLFEGLQAT
ncbi:MAG: hypothetical protein D6706_04650 [Chloroflexi bacterium]|nr:MAG: hypothetical protein D6706_04650 [Chloroflexota bacterium]